MHFRICGCCCNDSDKEKTVDQRNTERGGLAPAIIIPKIVVTEQPKSDEPIALDKITEVSVEESSVETIKESEIASVTTSSVQENVNKPTNLIESPTSVQQSTTPPTQQTNQTEPSTSGQQPTTQVTQFIPPSQQPPPVSSSKPNVNFNMTIDGNPLKLHQFSPRLVQGTFKGSQFVIMDGEFLTTDGAYSDQDKQSIMEAYFNRNLGMEEGLKVMESSMASFYGQASNPSAATTIDVGYTTRAGEQSTMTFTVIGHGHFRSSYMGTKFSVVNGQIITTDGVDSDLDKDQILINYERAQLGMQQGILGMQQGMLGMKQGMLGIEASFLGLNAGLTRSNTSQSSYNVLATGRETLKRMRSVNNGKRSSILEGGVIAQPRKPVMVTEDITDGSKKPRLFDEVDGREMSKLAEPVLKKTTFTTNAIIYEDPKDYEKLDKDELPNAKRLDEYIISLDESTNSGNRYYFHEAKPRRVTRKQLSPKEQLQIASVDRYSLFESQSVKAHNEFRKIHGVPPLVNNEFLCKVAKEWAEYLALNDAFYHRPDNEYGENLYYVDGMPFCAKKAVKAWYDEIDLYDYNNPKFSKETGHFTQLVWKDTREVGTGVAQIGDKVWVCCNYHPPGNYTDKFNDEFIPRPLIKRVPKS